jgi:hypothetical protein
MADLVAVIGGDRPLDDPQASRVELDDDLRVEMELVRVLLERDLLQRVAEYSRYPE